MPVHRSLLVFIVFAIIVGLTLGGNPFDGQDWTPLQIHIALAGRDDTGRSDGMSVMWNTKLQTDSSIVKYGEVSGNLNKQITGSSSAYYVTYNHVAVIKDLKPDTVYYYICGDEKKNSWSKERSFRSAPLAQNLRENWAFTYMADLGVVNGSPSTNYVGTMLPSSPIVEQGENARLVWHAGDAGYADDAFTHWGCYAKFCYEDTLDTYMQSASDKWAAQVPYMLTPGNHEADCHDPACLASKHRREALRNFTAYNARFHMPSVESNGTLNMHYSFNYGNVHFLSIDTETGFPNAPLEKRYILPCGGFADQMTWIEEDLKRANLPENRKAQPWVLVAGHRPMYDQSEVNVDFQKAMEDLFYKYGVDVYFAGHRHWYTRNYPVYKDIVDPNLYQNPKATTHITAGGAGNDEMKDIQRKLLLAADAAARAAAGEQGEPGVEKPVDPSPTDLTMVRSPSPAAGAWNAKNDLDNHVGITKVTIINDSKLRIDYIRTKTGEIYDTMTLERDHSPGKYPQV